MGPNFIRNIISELNQRLAGGIVSKVHQPDERNIILKVFAQGKDERLIISADHRFSRIHLNKREFANPHNPLRFCAFLRSRITGARIEGFYQIDNERIVRVLLKKRQDGDFVPFTLIAELLGKSANIILVDKDEAVLDALRYFNEPSPRVVLPGMELKPLQTRPEAIKEDILDKPHDISWNEAADAFYSRLLDEDEATREKNELGRVIKDARKKIIRKIENLEADRKKAESERGFGRFGELLVKNMGRLKRGAKEALCIDYTVIPPAEIKISLDEKLSPIENANKYFKRSKKAKTALELLEKRLPEARDELEYIDNLRFELESALTKEELGWVRDELSSQGYIRESKEPSEKKPEKTEPVRRFRSTEGFEILCGKSGKGNDLIVKKYAKEEDIWFHAAKAPGSHVLIKTAGRQGQLTQKSIIEAAQIAAWHSKLKNEKKAEVIYTQAKSVHKPKGAKPGSVTVKEYKSVIVEPKEPR